MHHSRLHPFAMFAAAAATLSLTGCQSTTIDPKVAALTPDSSTFRVEHTLAVPVPAGASQVEIWMPLPRVEPTQKTTDLVVEAPPGWSETTDANGNRYVHVLADAPTGKVTIHASFVVRRGEVNAEIDPAKTRPLTAAERASMQAYLGSNRHIVVNDEIVKLAAEIRGDEQNPIRVARKLYDWTLDNIEYWVKDPSKWKASPVGSSE
ncbi:MAG: hypothetical protein KDC98_17040 [Planctomycetes bacterium]|nr:hypothetical protein [Planctomycetota bacterium]